MICNTCRYRDNPADAWPCKSCTADNRRYAAEVSDTPPLPAKKAAVFHHPTLDIDLYDGLAMDLHAMAYAEPLLAELEKVRASATGTYRLLVSGDAVEPDDQWLQDDAVTWLPTPAWAVGLTYSPGPAMLPARRKMTATGLCEERSPCRRVVCAANRDVATGEIILGVRHRDSFMHRQAETAGNPEEQGFIDQDSQFLTKSTVKPRPSGRGYKVRR